MSVVTLEGNLLSADVLERLPELPGQKPADFGLSGRSLVDEVSGQWQAARAYWAAFQARRERSAGESLTTVTRDYWMTPLLELLGFSLQRITPSPVVEGRTYAISHWAGDSQEAPPVHIAGADLPLGNRPPSGRGTFSPHALVQDYLNRTEHLWGIVSNGLQLRLLRDSSYFTRPAFVEFDLETMFQDEQFDTFVQFYRLAHRTRLPAAMADGPECLVEKWHQQGIEEGGRIRDGLRGAVTEALQLLGNGFLRHRDNAETLPSDPREFYRQLLYLVYRLLFLLVAEDRDLLRTAEATPEQQEHYDRWLGLGHLRDLARTSLTAPERFDDLWLGLQTLFHFLRRDDWASKLGLSPLNGGLFRERGIDLCHLDNRSLLQAVRSLTLFTPPGAKGERPVNYRHLDVEELGSVYESLLDYEPVIRPGTPPTFAFAAGGERKSAGAYYTPSPLVQELIKSALEPVLAERMQAAGSDCEAQAKAVLSLTVCDPACGSGHFLLGAARRLGKELAVVRTGEVEPSPDQVRDAVRDVIGHCLYGVDKNPLAVDLCKVALWIEGHSRGRPLTFLEHRIREGDSLVGVHDLAVLEQGIPDGAYQKLTGDDGAVAISLRKQNKTERDARQGSLFSFATDDGLGDYKAGLSLIDEMPDDTPEQIHDKEYCLEQARASRSYRHTKLLCDAWTAAFFLPKTAEHREHVPTGGALRQGEDWWNRPGNQMTAQVTAAASRLLFFHWPLEFADVFAGGGFDLVIGNPPWDTLSPDQREFFGAYVDGLRSMAPKAQKAEIDRLLDEPAIAAAWDSHCRDLFALVNFLKISGAFTLYAPGNLGKGDFNVYRMFVELAMRRARPGGYAAQVVPAGLYGGANATAIRKFMLDHNRLVFLAGCENKGSVFFPGVHPQTWFALYTMQRGGQTGSLRATFGVDSVAAAVQARANTIEVNAELIRETAPATYAIPDVRDLGQLVTSQKMYAAAPAFGDGEAGPPLRHYSRELDMGNDRELFTTDPTGLPVYEGRMIDHFDHRAKTYQSGHGNSSVWIERDFDDPAKAIVPQWRVLPEKIPGKLGDRCVHYRVGFGDVANPRNVRSFVATLIPPGTICGHTVPTIVFEGEHDWAYLPWLAVANSFAMDGLVRRKLSSPHLSYTVLDGLPFPRPALTDAFVRHVAPVVLRLVCTAPEMTPYWNQMAALGLAEPVPEGTVPPTALLDPPARAQVRAELDAYVAVRVFGLTKQEMSDIMDTFEVLRRREEKAFGEFRTKGMVLEAWGRVGPG